MSILPRAATASCTLLALTLTLDPALPRHSGAAAQEPADLPRVGPGVDARVVVAWNELAHAIAYEEDQFLTFKGQRALAMMNLAMHDALNTIAPVYERYAYDGAVDGGVGAAFASEAGRATEAASASEAESAGEAMSAGGATGLADYAEGAAARAAYEVLRSQYPSARARLDSLWSALHGAPAPAQQAASIALGTAAAEAVLRSRDGDGWDGAGSYQFDAGPGRYQTTPDWDGFVLQPGFRAARPFAIESVVAFRPPPPPAVTDERYARDYDEVKAYGAAASPVRTADQTAYAIWWMEFAEGSVNRLARRLVMDQDVGLWEAARLFAHMHMALFDGYIVNWDSKYEYDHWRPYTAIRAAADDGNNATSPVPDWQSLRPAPPFPEYASAHATGCAAAFTVLASALDEAPFTMTTMTAPEGMPERSFPDFAAAARECADSRVQLGWHFRYSTDAGLDTGERVATHVLKTKLRPVASAPHDAAE